jgi:hypothetical protein
MSAPPSLAIVLELEAAPRLIFDCLSESEEKRLKDWLWAHSELLALAVRALELRDEPEATTPATRRQKGAT